MGILYLMALKLQSLTEGIEHKGPRSSRSIYHRNQNVYVEYVYHSRDMLRPNRYFPLTSHCSPVLILLNPSGPSQSAPSSTVNLAESLRTHLSIYSITRLLLHTQHLDQAESGSRSKTTNDHRTSSSVEVPTPSSCRSTENQPNTINQPARLT